MYVVRLSIEASVSEIEEEYYGNKDPYSSISDRLFNGG